MAEDREPLGFVAYEQWVAWALEQPLYFCQQPWENLSKESREVYEEMAAAVESAVLERVTRWLEHRAGQKPPGQARKALEDAAEALQGRGDEKGEDRG